MLAFDILAWLARVTEWLIALGPLGALLVGLVDSFIPLPGGSDLAVIGLSARNPALAPVTVLAATTGSVTGSTLVYFGARRAGAAALARFSPERRERVENLLGKYDAFALGIAAFLPPPFPFKIFNVVAGVLKMTPLRVISALLIGRLVRFSSEAALAVAYGDQAMEMIKTHGLLVLGVIVALGLMFWAYRAITSRRTSTVE